MECVVPSVGLMAMLQLVLNSLVDGTLCFPDHQRAGDPLCLVPWVLNCAWLVPGGLSLDSISVPLTTVSSLCVADCQWVHPPCAHPQGSLINGMRCAINGFDGHVAAGP